jgi:hypothetical protein
MRKNIYESYYIFKETSKLKDFIFKYKPSFNASEFTLGDIMKVFNDIIIENKLIDPNNTSMIICSPDMQNVLDRRATYFAELKNLVCFNHLVRVSGKKVNKFHLSRNLLQVFKTLDSFQYNRSGYVYVDICQWLSQYIINNNNKLMDPQNIRVVLCQNDLLGKAFKVKAFHRTQVTRFLRKCITLITKHTTLIPPPYKRYKMRVRTK